MRASRVGDFPYSILQQTAHRPWPMPRRPWVMTQSWHDLLFAHWRLDPARLRPLVPAPLTLDVRDGAAWLGIVPFHMTNVAPRGLPAWPALSSFAELNVRTYVSVGGRPGVYFFSLDAASTLAVAAARVLFGLPYFRAGMDVSIAGGEVRYRSHRAAGGAALEARYRPTGEERTPAPGSLDYFLTERYCLYTVSAGGRPRRVDIHHPPWALQTATAVIGVNTMAAAAGVSLPSVPPLLHYAARQDAVAWPTCPASAP